MLNRLSIPNPTKRDALIAAARASFGRLGYHATGTNDLVAAVSATAKETTLALACTLAVADTGTAETE